MHVHVILPGLLAHVRVYMYTTYGNLKTKAGQVFFLNLFISHVRRFTELFSISCACQTSCMTPDETDFVSNTDPKTAFFKGWVSTDVSFGVSRIMRLIRSPGSHWIFPCIAYWDKKRRYPEDGMWLPKWRRN